MSIGVIYFSSASKSKRMLDRNDLSVVNLKALVGEVELKDDSIEALFAEVEKTKNKPKSSQPTTGEIIEVIENMCSKFDDVIILTPSKYLSGTHQNTVLALQLSECANAQIVETKSFALSEYILTNTALDMIDKNCSLEEIIVQLNIDADKLVTYIAPGGFEYFRYSGRISGTSALVAGFMNLKVLIRHTEPDNEGEEMAQIICKKRGTKSIFKEIDKILSQPNIEKIYYSSLVEEEGIIDTFYSIAQSHNIEVEYADITSNIMGVHFGPGTFGYVVKYK